MARRLPGRVFASQERWWEGWRNVLLLVALATANVAGATARSSELLAAVVVEGLETLPEDTVVHYLRLEPGNPFDETAKADLNLGIRDLWASGLVDDVAIESIPGEDGLRLLVRVRERPLLVGVEYEGLSRLTRREVEERSRALGLELALGRPISLSQAHRQAATISEMYAERGFARARVEVTEEPITHREARLVFDIQEGERARVEEILFEGNQALSAERLRREMKRTWRGGPFWRRLKSNVLVPALLEQDLLAVRDLYRGLGFTRIEVGEPRIEWLGIEREAGPPKHEATSPARVRIVVPLDEGQRLELRGLSIEGNRRFSDQELVALLPRVSGGGVDAIALDEGIARVTELYRDAGYLTARVSVTTRALDDGAGDVLVAIEEGECFRVGRLEFRGNLRTRDAVLRREIAAREGEILDLGALRRSLARIESVGYFDLDDEDPAELAIDEESRTVDVLVHGSEADRTRFDVGASWRSGGQLEGRLSLETHDLLGRGLSLGLKTQGGDLVERFELAFANPWFLFRRQQLGARLFRRQQVYSTSEVTDSPQVDSLQEERGLQLSLVRSLGPATSFSLLAGYRQTEQRLTAGESTEAGPQSTSSIEAGYRLDTRDDPFDPTGGYTLRTSLELAGGVLGGERSHVRSEVGFSLFRRLADSPPSPLLALDTRAGWIETYGGTALFPLDGYFLGGPDSLRGFREGSIWVRNDQGELIFENGFAVGGRSFLRANLELRLRLLPPLDLVLFTDLGNVFGPDQSPGSTGLRSSAGVELRLRLPGIGLPLRLVWTENLHPMPGDQFETLRLAIGTSF